MVLESITTPLDAERRPWLLFIIGFLYTTMAVFIANWIFPDYAGIVFLTFIVMAFVPLLYATMKDEEEKDLGTDDEIKLLVGHSKALNFFMFLFLGITFSVGLLYLVMPTHISGAIFEPQISTINKIQGAATGVEGNVISINAFNRIFFNNIKVLGFCILFSLLYGAGAIFILAWNASVIGVAVGEFARHQIVRYASVLGFVNVSSYFQAIGLGLMRYMIHGIPEVAAYFVGALAGGILSVAIINHEIGTKKFEKVLSDVGILVVISLGMLLFGALLEVYVTPVFF
ncbi:MAG: stage II sporulation protein M [Nanoarchaeota archaeon]|nr:stage II sporulation protein M [Nanoarchaeota archaeon]